MTMAVVARNGIGHFVLATYWTWKGALDVFFGNKLVVHSMFLSDSSHNLDCLLHDFIAACAHTVIRFLNPNVGV